MFDTHILNGLTIRMNRSCTLFQLTEDLHFIHFNVTVPQNYICDGASVPRWLGFWLPHIGLYLPAAFLHDFLYEAHRLRDTPYAQRIPFALGFTRKQVDQMLLQQMKMDGIGWRTRYTIYYAVRLFGWLYW